MPPVGAALSPPASARRPLERCDLHDANRIPVPPPLGPSRLPVSRGLGRLRVDGGCGARPGDRQLSVGCRLLRGAED
ncbi:MAG: hypothetical protein B7X77_08030, partial [Caulobacter sp. 39-67-4]